MLDSTFEKKLQSQRHLAKVSGLRMRADIVGFSEAGIVDHLLSIRFRSIEGL